MANNNLHDDIPNPAGISFVGAIAVVIFYWIHLIVLSAPITANGVEITLFIAAFLAQYMPLAAIANKQETM